MAALEGFVEHRGPVDAKFPWWWQLDLGDGNVVAGFAESEAAATSLLRTAQTQHRLRARAADHPTPTRLTHCACCQVTLRHPDVLEHRTADGVVHTVTACRTAMPSSWDDLMRRVGPERAALLQERIVALFDALDTAALNGVIARLGEVLDLDELRRQFG